MSEGPGWWQQGCHPCAEVYKVVSLPGAAVDVSDGVYIVFPWSPGTHRVTPAKPCSSLA